jgi:hypothetical protein
MQIERAREGEDDDDRRVERRGEQVSRKNGWRLQGYRCGRGKQSTRYIGRPPLPCCMGEEEEDKEMKWRNGPGNAASQRHVYPPPLRSSRARPSPLLSSPAPIRTQTQRRPLRLACNAPPLTQEHFFFFFASTTTCCQHRHGLARSCVVCMHKHMCPVPPPALRCMDDDLACIC